MFGRILQGKILWPDRPIPDLQENTTTQINQEYSDDNKDALQYVHKSVEKA